MSPTLTRLLQGGLALTLTLSRTKPYPHLYPYPYPYAYADCYAYRTYTCTHANLQPYVPVLMFRVAPTLICPLQDASNPDMAATGWPQP